jgi:methylaspartate mutase sigma subunit
MTTTLPATPGRTVLVSTVASDAHTWNLVFLQLLIEELGHPVVNLGPCVADEELLSATRRHRPVLVAISTVNGHGHQEARRLIARLRADPEIGEIPVVIGGKLGISGSESDQAIADLLDAGFTAVFTERTDATMALRRLLVSTGEADRELR